MRNSKSLQDLHHLVAAKATRLISACYDDGIDLIITATLRDSETQAKRYLVGREVPGPNTCAQRPMGHVITDNPAGFSFHQFGLAFDAWPVVAGQVIIDWNEPDYSRVWKVIRRLARDPSINLRSGAEVRLSTGRREWGHFHYSAGLSIEAIRAGHTIPNVQI